MLKRPHTDVIEESADVTTLTQTAIRRTEKSSRIACIQLGCGWFSEQQGGLERYYDDLLEALPKVGVDCRGLVIGSEQVATESGGRVLAFAQHRDGLLGRWRGIRSASLQDPGLQSCELFVSHFACYAFPVLQQLRHLPMVVHFHGPWGAEGQQEGGKRLNVLLKGGLEGIVYRRADRIITLSAAFRDYVCRNFKVNPELVHVVPGGVKLDNFTYANEISRRAARQKLGWPVDRPIVLTVRRLLGRMGLDNLIDAVHQVRQQHPDVLCLIAGRGRMEGILQQHINALNLSEHVKLIGFVPDTDLPYAYRAADFTIMPSVSLEGFGLSAAESLAAGTPALVTPVGGLPEVVAKLDPNLVMASSQTVSLAQAMQNALTNPGSLPDESSCRDYAAREFNWHTIATQVREVYAEALK
jgi:glycosyltransferase involved in cell wall biosynthesis